MTEFTLYGWETNSETLILTIYEDENNNHRLIAPSWSVVEVHGLSRDWHNKR